MEKEKFNYYLGLYREKQEALQEACETHLRVVSEATEGGGVSQDALEACVRGYHDEKLREQSTTTIFEFAESLKTKRSSNRQIMPEMLALPRFKEDRQTNLKRYFTGEKLNEACQSCERYIPFADQKDTVEAEISSLDSQHGDVWGVYVDLSSAHGIWHALLIGQKIRECQPDDTPLHFVAYEAKTNRMLSLDETKMRGLLTSLFELSKTMSRFEDEDLRGKISEKFYDFLDRS